MLIPKFNHKPDDNGDGSLINRTLPAERDLYVIIAVTLIMMFFITEPLFRLLGKASYFLLELLIVFPAMMYLIDKKLRWKTVLRLNGISWELAGMSVLIGLSMAVISDELDRLVSLVYTMPEDVSKTIAEGLVVNNFFDLILIGFGVVVVAGVAEEALFRGFLQRSLEKHRGVTQAVTTASIVFALIHLNPWWIIQILILAMLLGILAWRADSILPGVIVHAINNGLGLWAVNSDIEYLPFYTWKGHVSPLILIPAIYIIVWSLKRFFVLTSHLHPEETDEVDSMVESGESGSGGK